MTHYNPVFRNRVKDVLSSKYGIDVISILEVPAGWCAFAYKISGCCEDYFLKVYDKSRHSIKEWIARTDIYIPTVLWLYDHTPLRENMTAPILTKDGLYQCEDDYFAYLLFPFIHGQTLGSTTLTSEQIRELAYIVAQLHTYGIEIPILTNPLRETFDTSFCDTLIKQYPAIQESLSLKEAPSHYFDIISSAISILKEITPALSNTQDHFHLCHTDIHGWNLIQSKKLILIDWEGLTFAPPEADLYVFTDGFFFDYARNDFFPVYSSIHKQYQINEKSMLYYRLRRRLKDISEFVDSLLSDHLTLQDKKQSLHYLEQECKQLFKMIQT